MNIELKIALDNVKALCDTLGDGKSMDLLIKDVYTFIMRISQSGGRERFDRFCSEYLGGITSADKMGILWESSYPEILKKICSIEKGSAVTGKTTATDQLVSFFTILGESYLSGAKDKGDIDKTKYNEYIDAMKQYIENPVELQPATSAPTQTASEQPVQASEQSEEPEESFDELYAKLQALIGLENVKKEVDGIINLIKVSKKGEEFGEKMPPISLHLVFYGNPGTGKTTVARLLAKIYKSLGVLSKGHTVEVDRSQLVAGYVGQTAIKTKGVIDQALGGILFIDEAYTLTHGKGESDFGQEAVDEILKAMEDNRDDLIVIVAGYPELMKEFIGSNPGLRSRFNKFINFEDYDPQELEDIFRLQCKNQNYILADECDDFIKQHFTDLYENRDENYANGRDVRNYFENVVQAHANRLSEKLDSVTHDEYLTIEVSDLEEGVKLQSEI